MPDFSDTLDQAAEAQKAGRYEAFGALTGELMGKGLACTEIEAELLERGVDLRAQVAATA